METGLPPTDQTKLAEESHDNDYEEEEEDNEPFNSPHPPP
jgi:hypothetical protein